MKDAGKLKPSRGLIGEGFAAVFGLPQGFDLATKLPESSRIRLVTAFAHPSGWNLIGDSIAACKGQVDILVGLDFFSDRAQVTSYLAEEFISVGDI